MPLGTSGPANFANPNVGTGLLVTATGFELSSATVNSVGTLITTLYEAQAQGGKDYMLSLSGTNLPSGVYFCRVVRNGNVENKRLTVAK